MKSKALFKAQYAPKPNTHYKVVRKAHSFRGGMDSTFIL